MLRCACVVAVDTWRKLAGFECMYTMLTRLHLAFDERRNPSSVALRSPPLKRRQQQQQQQQGSTIGNGRTEGKQAAVAASKGERFSPEGRQPEAKVQVRARRRARFDDDFVLCADVDGEGFEGGGRFRNRRWILAKRGGVGVLESRESGIV